MKKIAFIGQAPARPGSKHEISGTYLQAWLHDMGLAAQATTESCLFLALSDTFPGNSGGNHKVPTPEMISEHLPILKKQLQQFQPQIVVPVGKLAIAYVLGIRNFTLDDVVGKKFVANPFNVLKTEVLAIPLPHPSGRSTWRHSHQAVVDQALNTIKCIAQSTL